MSSNSTATLPTKDQYFRDLKADPTLADYKGDCPVCYDPFDQAIRTICRHIVCLSCLTKCMTLKNTCPMCRREQYQHVQEQEQDEDEEDSIDEVNGWLPLLEDFYAFALDWSGANQMFDVYGDPDEDAGDGDDSDNEDADEQSRPAEGEDVVQDDREASELSDA